MYIPNLKFLAQFGGELCEEQTQKIRKIPLLNVHTKLKPLSSIWREDKGGTALFQGLKGEKSPYLPSLLT